MRKILMIALGVLFAGNAMAIENEPAQGFTEMAFLGLNTSNIRGTNYDGKVGGTMGFRLDYVLPKAHGTYLTAGLDWGMKGGKYDTFRSYVGEDDADATV